MKSWAAETVITPARIGPAQGRRRSRGCAAERSGRSRSRRRCASLGGADDARDPGLDAVAERRDSSVIPKPSRTTIASVRSEVVREARARRSRRPARPSANVNESVRPATIAERPRARRVTPAESTAGRTGSTQGESAVPRPRAAQNTTRSNIANSDSGLSSLTDAKYCGPGWPADHRRASARRRRPASRGAGPGRARRCRRSPSGACGRRARIGRRPRRRAHEPRGRRARCPASPPR